MTAVIETTVQARGAAGPSLPARVARTVVAMLALLLAAPSVVYLRDALQPDRALYKDFGQEYLLARAMADGINPYQPIRDLAARYLSPTGLLDKPFPTPHPPTVGVLFWPFLLVDYPTAVQIWFAVELISLPILVLLAMRLARLRIGIGWTLAVACALLGWNPVLVDLGLAQVTLVMAALLAGAQVALVYRRGALGGVLLGVALALKPLAWPWLIVLIWQRRFSAVLSMCCVLAFLVVIAVLRVGVGPVLAYATQVMPSVSTSYAAEPTNISLWTVGTRLFDATSVARLLDFALPLAIVLLATAWLTRQPDLRTALSVFTCVTIVVSPIAWEYDLVLLIVPATQLLSELYRHRFPRALSVFSLLLAAGLYVRLATWQAATLPLAPTLLVILLGLLLVASNAQSTYANPRSVAVVACNHMV